MAKKWIICLVALVLLAGCAAPQGVPPSTTSQTEPPQTTPGPAETQPAETSAPAPQREFLPLISQGTISQEPGTVSFYIEQTPVYCGQPVKKALLDSVDVQGNVKAMVQPFEYSDEVRLRLRNSDGRYEDTLSLIAVNPTQEPRTVEECLIYSLSAICEPGHRFGLGAGEFVTGETTAQEIIDAWGEPDAHNVMKQYQELVYYRPFSFLQVIVHKDVVEQVRAYHCAYLYPQLAQEAAPGDYTDSDALLQLGQHMDITPYLAGGKGQNGPLESVITVDDTPITMGVIVLDLPQPWQEIYRYTRGVIDPSRYFYTQYPGQEGFVVANTGKVKSRDIRYMVVKGIHVFNPEYTGWGVDQSSLRQFDYCGIAHDSTIEDVIQVLGQPYEIAPSSGPGWCFVWLHYRSDQGTTVRIQVDPVSNQIVELRLEIRVRNVYPYE